TRSPGTEGRRDLPHAAAPASFSAATRSGQRLSGDRAHPAGGRQRRVRVVLPAMPLSPPPRRGAVEEHRARSSAALRAVLCEQGAAHLRKVRRCPPRKKLSGDSNFSTVRYCYSLLHAMLRGPWSSIEWRASMNLYTLRNKPGLLIVVALGLGGCGGMPKNAEEFRQFTLERTRVLGTLSVPKETFEVERPFRDVSSTLQKKADECLKVAIKWTVTNSYGNT